LEVKKIPTLEKYDISVIRYLEEIHMNADSYSTQSSPSSCSHSSSQQRLNDLLGNDPLIIAAIVDSLSMPAKISAIVNIFKY
jgi:hypothetical protein